MKPLNRPVANLIPYARNARTHSSQQVAQLAAAIVEFGWTYPVLVDGDSSIIAGHGRILAAQMIYESGGSITLPPDGKGHREKVPDGMVPIMECAGWSEAQKRAYILADNKLALNAGWDNEMLKVELQDLTEQGFDLGLTGFEADEINLLFNGWNSDIAPSERDGENTSGIDALIRITVDRESEQMAREKITNALDAAGVRYECK